MLANLFGKDLLAQGFLDRGHAAKLNRSRRGQP